MPNDSWWMPELERLRKEQQGGWEERPQLQIPVPERYPEYEQAPEPPADQRGVTVIQII